MLLAVLLLQLILLLRKLHKRVNGQTYAIIVGYMT